jgi:hypothetical protein
LSGGYRCCPLLMARGVARPARTTMLRPVGDGSQLDRRVRPILGEPLLAGKSPEGLAAAGWGDSNSGPPPEAVPGGGCAGAPSLPTPSPAWPSAPPAPPCWPAGCAASPTPPDRPGLQPSRGCTCGRRPGQPPGRTSPEPHSDATQESRAPLTACTTPPTANSWLHLASNTHEITAHNQLVGGTGLTATASPQHSRSPNCS